MAQETVELAEIQLNFRRTVQPGQGSLETQSFNRDGKITQVLFHFPPGSAGLVQCRLLKDEKLFYPIRGYLALDNATPVYYVDADYYGTEPLTFEVLNRDAANPHTPTCTVVIRYKKAWWEKLG